MGTEGALEINAYIMEEAVDELDETAGGLGPPQGSVDSRSEAT